MVFAWRDRRNKKVSLITCTLPEERGEERKREHLEAREVEWEDIIKMSIMEMVHKCGLNSAGPGTIFGRILWKRK
jgi:hypothetical protein